MYDVELKIKKEDWVFIILIGIVFGSIVSALGYSLFNKELLDGAFFGGILGLFISLFSLIFVSISNGYILPKLPHSYWQVSSMFFSFLSGFFGALLAAKSALFVGIELLDAFAQKMFEISAVIGLLTYIVGVLLHRFVKMRNQNEVTNELLLKSRISSLETQLNPHFLFNSINSIVELIHKDKIKAEEALLGISSFLRSVMKEASMITIEEELENIRRYVELENMRFDDKIHLNISADNETLNCLTPKFSIGLIVENAIKHGFEPQKMLNIVIVVAKNRDKIEISVENDGKELASRVFGIGLQNLSERLKYLCDGSVEFGFEGKKEFIISIKAMCENTNSRR
jgi:two-component system, LytTR family, sensor kinase